MFLTGGFVLGEVMALLSVKVEMGLLVCIMTGVLWYCVNKNSSRRPVIWILLLFCCLAGYVRMDWERSLKPWEEHLAGTGGKAAGFLGDIVKIEEGGNHYALTLTDCRMIWADRMHEMPDMLAYVEKDEYEVWESQTGVRIGMEVSFTGNAEKPGSPRNPGGFDYASYYRSLGIGCQVFAGDFKVADGRYRAYQDGLYRLRLRGKAILDRLCEPEDAGVFQAAVLGDKSSLDEELRTLYQRNGIAHLLAISGLHISLVGLGFYRALRKAGAGFGVSGCLGGLLIVSYGVMTGGAASVFRAVAMVLIYMLAEYLGRCYDMLSAAALAAILLLAESPYLLFQAGFQLSFGAVLAIGGLGPWLSRQLMPKTRAGKALLLGLSIQLVTYPVILYHFFQYPIYGIFLNLLVIPFMQYAVLSGIAGIFLGALCDGAGILALGSGHYILELYSWLCRVCDKLPGANLVIGRPNIWQLAFYFMLLAGVMGVISRFGCGQEIRGEEEEHSRNRLRKAKLARWAMFLSGCLLCFFILWQPPVKGLAADFLDVGQGDGICIRTDRTVILVDGGSSSEKELGKYTLEPYLKSKGISIIDYAVVSHGDSDHISGLQYLLEQDGDIRIRNLLLPWLGKGDAAYETLVKLTKAHGGNVHWMKQGERIVCGKLTLSCVYHGNEEKKEDVNEHSLVLGLEYGRFEMLLTGDMSSIGELEMLEEKQEGYGLIRGEAGLRTDLYRVRILKAAHHGSKHSTCEEFLREADPQYAVLSFGAGNSYGHPHPEVIKRLEAEGISVWKTADTGAVMFSTDGKEVWVRTMAGQ